MVFKYVFMPLTSCSKAPYFVFEQLMKKLNFDCSLKNIPTSDNTTHNLKLIKKTETFLNSNKKQEQERINYGFKLRHHLPRCTELEEFEKVRIN